MPHNLENVKYTNSLPQRSDSSVIWIFPKNLGVPNDEDYQKIKERIASKQVSKIE